MLVFNLLFLPFCSGFDSSLSKAQKQLDSPIKGFVSSSACWELCCSGVGLFREATAHPDTSQSGFWYCGWPPGKVASFFNLAISGLLLTTHLEGKDEHTLAFKSYFVRSHWFQMQRVFWDSFLAYGEGKNPIFHNVLVKITFFILLRLACIISLVGTPGNLATSFRNDSEKSASLNQDLIWLWYKNTSFSVKCFAILPAWLIPWKFCAMEK